MTREEISDEYIKVKITGIPALHQHPRNDWAYRCVLGWTAKKQELSFKPIYHE